MKIGFIGAGKMAEAFISGMLAKQVCNPRDLLLSDLDVDRLAALRAQYGVDTLGENAAVVERCDAVVLAVKPQHLDGVLDDIAPLASGRLFVSIAAGCRLASLEARLVGARMVRVMPNLPFQVGEGMSVCCRGATATEGDVAMVRQMLESGGKVLEMDESFFDVVTALSGSGPAFFAYFLQSWVEAAVAQGMAADIAFDLALQTMRGTAAVMMQAGIPPTEFIKHVASKGGTTAAGLTVLDASDFHRVVKQTLDAATQRSAELSV
jgi:pyrroline-5-carboxylate reductase